MHLVSIAFLFEVILLVMMGVLDGGSTCPREKNRVSDFWPPLVWM